MNYIKKLILVTGSISFCLCGLSIAIKDFEVAFYYYILASLSLIIYLFTNKP